MEGDEKRPDRKKRRARPAIHDRPEISRKSSTVLACDDHLSCMSILVTGQC